MRGGSWRLSKRGGYEGRRVTRGTVERRWGSGRWSGNLGLPEGVEVPERKRVQRMTS